MVFKEGLNIFTLAPELQNDTLKNTGSNIISPVYKAVRLTKECSPPKKLIVSGNDTDLLKNDLFIMGKVGTNKLSV